MTNAELSKEVEELTLNVKDMEDKITLLMDSVRALINCPDIAKSIVRARRLKIMSSEAAEQILNM